MSPPNWNINFVNVKTLAAWLSQMTVLTFKPPVIKSSKQFKSSYFNNSLLINVTGTALTSYDTFSFNPIIIKHTILLYSSLLMFEPKNSPPQYSTYFCKYISSNRTSMSLEILLFSSNNFAAFKASMSLLWSYLIKTWRVMENRLTVTCMTAIMYNEAVMHIVLFH